MEFLLVCAIFAIACTYAIAGAVNGVKKAYRKRMKAWRKKNKDATDFGLRMAMLGQMLAMLRFGPRAMVSEAKEQFKVGWDRGTEWAKKHGYHPDDRLDLDDDDLDDDDLDDDDLDDDDEEDGVGRHRRRDELERDDTPFPKSEGYTDDPGFNDRPRPRPRPAPTRKPNLQLVKSDPTPNQPTRRGGPPVAVDVSTPEQLLAALREIRDNARADRDDAGTAVTRDEEELKNVDAIIARVTALKFDPKHIAIVQSLRDPCAAALAAANDRKAAADAKYAAAENAVAMAQKHMQLQAAGAAGELYQGG